MRISVLLIVFSLIVAGCSNNSLFDKEFGCTNSKMKNTEEVSDFFENFSVKIPKNWKTSFYYDSLQSEIFSADTTKVFEETYMMEFSMINAKMIVDDAFKKKVNDKTKENGLHRIKQNFIDFKGYKGYYYYGKTFQNETELYVFQYYLKLNEEQYLMVKTEIFGNEKVEERLCDSFAIINSLEVKQKNIK